MNIVLREPKNNGEFFISSVARDGDKFIVRSKRMDVSGKIVAWNLVDTFNTLEEAKLRAKKLAFIKRKHKGMIEIDVKNFPNTIKPYLDSVENQVSICELAKIIKDYCREMYVVFNDNTGMEDCFDVGVEYVGHLTDDADTMDVFDKFGQKRGVRKSRLESIRETEYCIEAKKINLKEVA